MRRSGTDQLLADLIGRVHPLLLKEDQLRIECAVNGLAGAWPDNPDLGRRERERFWSRISSPAGSAHPPGAPAVVGRADRVSACWIDHDEAIVLAGLAPAEEETPKTPVRSGIATVRKLIDSVCSGRPPEEALSELLPGIRALRRELGEGVADVVLTIYGRACAGEVAPRPEALRAACIGTCVHLAVAVGDRPAATLLDGLVDNPGVHARLLSVVPGAMAPYLVADEARGHEDADARRSRAWHLLGRLSRNAASALATAGRAGASRDEVEGLAYLLDRIALQLYFSSGSGDSPGHKGDLAADDLPGRTRFLRESLPTFGHLAQVGYPGIVYDLVRALAGLAPFGPRDVILAVSRMVCAAEQWGFSRERMGLDQVVPLVRRYLADHRDVLIGDAESWMALLAMLDTFVRVGWPPAVRLVAELDRIYR
jgi:hypothetical protein